MTMQHTLADVDEPGLARLAELVAFAVRTGDLIALHGDLGAGKTTFARAFLMAMAHPDPIEVPSPTFTLVQTYELPRLKMSHFDLYRLIDPAELDELGLDDLIAGGAALVEWPDHGGTRLPGTRLDIEIAENTTNPNIRTITLTGAASWAQRLERLVQIRNFLSSANLSDRAITYLQGDASVRRYARLHANDGTRTILMDWQRQPDGPPIRNGRPYSRIAHLAESVHSFVAIGGELGRQGFATPAILHADLEGGLLVIEDFGDAVFGTTSRTHDNQAQLWRLGVDTLAALAITTPPAQIPLADATAITMPRYDHEALGIETELLLDWYWPALHGTAAPPQARAEYTALWAAVFDRLATMPQGWVLRDYHSPNLLWLPDRHAPKNVGIIDFQDAQIGPRAYDLVSLLQDARVDVAPDLEAQLLAHYCDTVGAQDGAFDNRAFLWSYAALGAQRNSKILGIFARLAHRDGKPQYLAHIPRIWRYLARDLQHRELAALQAWYDLAFPQHLRDRPIMPTPAPVPL